MATNTFFNNYMNQNEQNLVDDLVLECIRMHGIDVYYISRELGHVDKIMNEDRIPIFNRAFQIEVYPKDFMSFQGDGDFMSRFGLQIRDSMTFDMAIRSFEEFVRSKAPDLIRPKEGDLIFFPLNRKFFEITFNEHESVFYQMGALQVYELKCELFEYSNERFETGIPLLDTAFDSIKTSVAEDLETLEDIDAIARNLIYEEESDEFVDFTEFDPFEEEITFPRDR